MNRRSLIPNQPPKDVPQESLDPTAANSSYSKTIEKINEMSRRVMVKNGVLISEPWG